MFNQKNRSILKISLIAFVLIFAALGGFLWPKIFGDSRQTAVASARPTKVVKPYDLTRLDTLNKVIIRVKDHYVEPDRIDSKRMLLAGLNAIQKSVAPVLVNYDEDQHTVTVQVEAEQKKFRTDDVTSPWNLAFRMREIFAFLQDNLKKEEDTDLQAIEYATVNGMLHTLDPHSVLLTPEVYEEMRMSTRGEFGGLGIVISIRDGQLTVIKPMEDTPASRAGLRRMDRIVKINDESTLNMPLSEAVNRLRGAPGSKVTAWVVREGAGGFSEPKSFELERAVIHIPSIEHRVLKDNIGYLKIKSFQGNTADDMMRALAQLHRSGIRGLVLDMRDNPGGLLDQAVRVVDAFLKSGTIVTTSSNDPSQRDEKVASPDGTEPTYPMVVLVNGGSASASEIVAGALKNHDRALVIGQPTFGKGSVQVLYDFEDNSALKLTIAQYLTPGDVSIQGVGIVPDIAVDPMTVDREDMDLEVDKTYLRESDLRSHLTHERARDSIKPSVVIRYYLPSDKREQLRQAMPEELEENQRESEFLIDFSRSLLSKAPDANRQKMLKNAGPVLEITRAQEMNLAVQDLNKLGVDWSPGKDSGDSELVVDVSTNKSDNTAKAGDPFTLRVKVTNRGKAPVYQLRAVTKSDFRLFEGRELVFGKLEPGQTKEWTTSLGICTHTEGKRQCGLPKSTSDRADVVRLEFTEAHGHIPKPVEIRTVLSALARPEFAYAVQISDQATTPKNSRSNGDGVVQAGEQVTLYTTIKNIGHGRTLEAQANLRSLSGTGVLLKDGRFKLPALDQNQETTVEFTLEIKPEFDQSQVKLEISMMDTELGVVLAEKINIPIEKTALLLKSETTQGSVKEGTVVFQSPQTGSTPIATIKGGGMRVTGQASVGEFTRIDLGKGRPGWVQLSDVQTGRESKASVSRGKPTFVIAHTPPHLTIEAGDIRVTREPFIDIRGKAVDETEVRDVYIFAGSRKVFYQSNRNAKEPHTAVFDGKIPLQGGMNYVTIVARQDNQVISRRTMVVRRDASDGSTLPTPKSEDELGDEDEHLD